ncbi:DHS-like NAD/FAD-binding domain-containing protein [Gymnopus androsaceus JB14]|uniref:NAD-dependent protein deacylase n=1 Tax=Gymnopus androsaceus JB14 TaxID=1447944 RepID=A0A6A4HLS6_9AGAR|nr:DHS-like NAD/FAD-binding domain-containing protein [Gymnopus androsaceus JB14]
MNQFKHVLKKSKNIIVVAGAGLSAASGIPTFRGKGGMWRKYDALTLATPEGFAENPSLVWQFYHYRRETALKAQPNAAHVALARFSLSSIRESIAPGSTFTLITQVCDLRMETPVIRCRSIARKQPLLPEQGQVEGSDPGINVDGLSPLALEKVMETVEATDREDARKPKIVEMHGRLFDVKCTSCDHVEFNRSSPICEGLAGTEILVEKNVMDPEIPRISLPRCSSCGALARPGVVWFGETIPNVDDIDAIVEDADLCLVVGTASTVYPAAGFAEQVQKNGGNVAVFNIDHSAGDKKADFLFLGPCQDLLPQALGMEA